MTDVARNARHGSFGLSLSLVLTFSAGLAACTPDVARGPDDPAWLDRPANGPAVVELQTPWLPGCGDGCTRAYFELAESFPDPGRSMDDATLRRVLAAAVAAPAPKPLGLSRSELRQRIIGELNIGFLVEGMRGRGLAVATLGESRVGCVTRRKLLFFDPMVGTFEGTLLVPDGAGRFPAVLGLHGHRHDDARFMREYMGETLAQNGYVVLAPRFRVHDCSWSENQASLALLRNGLTLMGMRVYESLLMLEYLRSLADVDDDHIGILGHSGGSSVAGLVVRISDGVAAVVTDYQVDYRNTCGPQSVHCETVPGLFPLSADINDLRNLDVPSRLVPYKYPTFEDRTGILAFFDRHLRAPHRRASSAR